jgi:membrane protease YdiL (CAAX protease family)
MATYLDYARRGKNQWWRYLAALALGMVPSVLIAVLIVALYLLRLIPPESLQELAHPSSSPIFFGGVVLQSVAIVAGLLTGVALVQGKSFFDLMGRWRWRLFLAGGALWLPLLAAMTFADVVIAPGGFRYSANPATTVLAICALCALPIQTFTEELLFRGYITQGLLLATKRPAVAAVLAGLAFGALHIPNGAPQAVAAAGFGVATSLIAIRLSGIAFTFGMHLVNNLVGAVIVVSSGDIFAGAPGLFTQTTPRLTWWDVAVELVALALVAWLVLRRGRRSGSSRLRPAPPLEAPPPGASPERLR